MNVQSMRRRVIFLMGDASYESELIDTGEKKTVFNLYIHFHMKLPLKKNQL